MTSRLTSLFLAGLLLCGCLDYREEWRFNEDGQGSVRITCEPSPHWRKYARATNWLEAATLFLPPYRALSQSCARAGIRIDRCRFETREGKPRIDLLISFDSLRNVARCNLFADRLLQWSRNRRTVTLLHRLRPPGPLLAAGAGLLDDNWLSDGSFEVRTIFPGRVIECSGAERKGRAAILRLPLTEVADGRGITIMATARTAYPLILRIAVPALALALVCAAGALLWNLYKKKRSPPSGTPDADSRFDSQYW